METLIEQIKTLAQSSDDSGRRGILDALFELQNELEAPSDTLKRLYGSNLYPTIARIGADLKLFEIISASDDPRDVSTLATRTKADPLLLGRLLRFMASVGMINETAKDAFSANKTTKLFAQPGYHGGIHHIFDTLGLAQQSLPDLLLSTSHQNPSSTSRTALQVAFATDLAPFKWFPTQPQRFAHFQALMTVNRNASTWLSVFPLSSQLADWDSPAAENQALFVDIGGGFGQQCQALKASVAASGPVLKGRIILQDLPPVIARAPALEGVEMVAHDFFEEQPVKGAKFYYLRNILHDWPDAEAVTILRNVAAAMAPHSRVLVDDIVLPERGVHRYAAALDISMMAVMGSRERTGEQWEAVVEAAGLRVLGRWIYDEVMGGAVQELGLRP